MFMVMLLCLLVFPHDSFGAERDCSACAAGLECANLCDCSDHSTECTLDASHMQAFRSDTTQNPALDLTPVFLICMIHLPDDPQWALSHLDPTAGLGSRSFAVRHLDTIILRV